MIKTVLKTIFILIFIQACAGQTAYNTVSSYAYGLITGNPYKPITTNYYETQKYSFAMAKVGRADPVRLILEKKEGQLYKWVSADKTIIYTNIYGKIVKSKGLKNDIDLRMISGQNISSPQLDEILNKDIKFSANFLEPELLNIRGYESFSRKTHFDFEYFEDQYKDAVRYDFQSHFPIIKWHPKGSIIVSQNRILSISQYIHPHHPRVDLYFYYK